MVQILWLDHQLAIGHELNLELFFWPLPRSTLSQNDQMALYTCTYMHMYMNRSGLDILVVINYATSDEQIKSTWSDTVCVGF